jgi:alpha-beta hydrolase superfamily lysophospholipase
MKLYSLNRTVGTTFEGSRFLRIKKSHACVGTTHMMRVIITIAIAVLVIESAWAYSTELNFDNVSNLPIHAFENKQAKFNFIAILGGAGLKNKKGKSKNFLVTQKSTFTNSNLNYYLFPNWSESEKANYQFRASKKRADRILELVAELRKRNSLPTYLGGFSRGSVDAASFAKKYPDKIKGIVLMSGIYTNSSKKAELFSMENIIGSKIDVNTLVTHHKKDACKVTQFKHAKSFYEGLKAPVKQILLFKGGIPSGRECGPLHHHGYENIEEEAAKKIIEWLMSDVLE